VKREGELGEGAGAGGASGAGGPAAGEHYFAEHPAARPRPGSVHVVTSDLHLELDTDSGMFSPSRLDPGTRLLLEAAPRPPARGDLLDLGCGYGPLALVLAARSPGARIWAVDVNTRALELCARNAERAGLANVWCAPPGDPALPGTFALIWSNPPIRIGKAALHALLASWLGRLAVDGAAYLVVQRNLGSDSLQRWLDEAGWPAERIAARSGYRVLRVGSTAGTGR
jgi:16S rRNA (guanine1207-N2)-methyltransferase